MNVWSQRNYGLPSFNAFLAQNNLSGKFNKLGTPYDRTQLIKICVKKGLVPKILPNYGGYWIEEDLSYPGECRYETKAEALKAIEAIGCAQFDWAPAFYTLHCPDGSVEQIRL